MVNPTVINVTGMTCEHCVNVVRTEIGKLPGVHEVAVDLSTGTVRIMAEHEPDEAALKAAVAEAGYEVAR
jgi:copper chaperone